MRTASWREVAGAALVAVLGSLVLTPTQADTGHRSLPQAQVLVPSPSPSSAAGGTSPVVVVVDTTVASPSRAVKAQVVGEVPGGLILTDAHASRPGGMGLCQAGTERFLRVLATRQGALRETYRVKLESCRDDIELASPGLDWQASTGMLRIEWLQGPGKKGAAEVRVLRVGAQGVVNVLPEQ